MARRKLLPLLALSAAAAFPVAAAEQGGVAPVSLDLASPRLGQAPSGLLSELWRAALQTASSFIPVLGLAPAGRFDGPPPPLPPSAVGSRGETALSDAPPGPPQDAAGSGERASRLGETVLPGGILPLRASEGSGWLPISRRPSGFAQKAEALKRPLQDLADLRSQAGAESSERASGAGRAIADIVADEWERLSSAPSAGAARPARASNGWADRDAVASAARSGASAAPSSPAAAAIGAIGPGADRPGSGAVARGAAVMETFGSLPAYSGSAARPESWTSSARGGPRARASAPAGRVDLALLLLRVYDASIDFLRRLGGWPGSTGGSPASARSGAPGAPGAAAQTGGRAPARPGDPGPEPARLGRSEDADSVFSSGPQADSADLAWPLRLPAGALFALLVPLAAIALLYSKEY